MCNQKPNIATNEFKYLNLSFSHVLFITLYLMSQSLWADRLQDYAAECDGAIGFTVPSFECTLGSKIPVTNRTTTNCDKPARLGQIPDGCVRNSRFLNLHEDENGFAVAICRKGTRSIENTFNIYDDIAVIQHNWKNGATCFYQSETGEFTTVAGSVKAPSFGTSAWDWILPNSTAGSNCAQCHDNGALIRSPYLTQMIGPNELPIAPIDGDQNVNGPYHFIGDDFKDWQTYSVEVENNQCLSCHRMGVSNLNINNKKGSARNLGLKATGNNGTETWKNDHDGISSPIWMPPGFNTYFRNNEISAEVIANCGNTFNDGIPLPNDNSCRIRKHPVTVNRNQWLHSNNQQPFGSGNRAFDLQAPDVNSDFDINLLSSEDPYLYIMDKDSNQLFENDDIQSPNRDSRIEGQATLTDYPLTVIASTWANDKSGSFVLQSTLGKLRERAIGFNIPKQVDFEFTTKSFNECMRVSTSDKVGTTGFEIYRTDCTDSSKEHFYIEQSPVFGSFKIKSAYNGYCVFASQSFRISASGPYTIYSRPCDGLNGEDWFSRYNDQDGFYEIENRHTGKCMTAAYNTQTEEGEFQIYQNSCSSNNTQTAAAQKTKLVHVGYLVGNPDTSGIIFKDDFESGQGWIQNPNGTDTATTGQWERANPEATDYNGPKQLDNSRSGFINLVTGASSGTSVGSNDVDNGVTTVLSPAINLPVLPAGKTYELSFSYYFSHASNSSNSDFLKVKIIGSLTREVLVERGSADDDDAYWRLLRIDISEFSGESINIQISAADHQAASLVEAAVEDVIIQIK